MSRAYDIIAGLLIISGLTIWVLIAPWF